MKDLKIPSGRYSLSKKVGIAIGLVFVATLLSKSRLFCSPVTAFCEAENEAAQNSTQIATQYFTFSQDKLAESLKEGKHIVLYFHAPWCTTCSSFDQELKTQESKLDENVLVLRIDYDSSVDLRKQYGVTYQHTLVLLNNKGGIREMWLGGDLNSLLDYLKRNP